MFSLPRCLQSTCGGGLYRYRPSSFFPGCLLAAFGGGIFCFPNCLRSNFGGGLFRYRLHSFGKLLCKQSCFSIIFIFITLHIQAQALSLRKPKYRSFSNNSIAALHDTVIYGTNFKTEFADASTRFKFLKTKADELVGFNVSIQTVLSKKLTNTDDIKNMMELRNQVKLHQLREDDERFEIILLTIKAYVS